MELRDVPLTFSREKRSRPRYVLIYLVLNLLALAFARQVFAGEITLQTILRPTPTPTRNARSWVEEARAHFEAGNLNAAIEAYRAALALEPRNGDLWAELTRTLVYSSALLTNDTARYRRLQEAVEAANQAVTYAPNSSMAHAARAFALDWLATNPLTSPDQREALLAQAETAASQARTLDPGNGYALAYYAEILLDQQSFVQAYDEAQIAVERAPEIMDTHRVYATVLEANGRYLSAIQEYKEAIRRAPNLTFLYLRVGFNYRHLAGQAKSKAAREEYYELARTYFAQAIRINQRLGIADPIPYIAISKTYVQEGQFFAASLNAEKALILDPADPLTYAQLGVIYIKSRNYEGSVPVLQCAVEGCGPEVSGQILNEIRSKHNLDPVAEGPQVEPLPLTNPTVAYYYLQYASVLAALNMCDRAYPILDRVEALFGSDPVIANIIAENRNICRLLRQKATPRPTATPTPAMTPTP
ncbi:MAG: tetratricopeptide repeat protein [Chloroflexi bacterium]|nr:tetratricopeptide repeat protein [Chloroflexota bacterium]